MNLGGAIRINKIGFVILCSLIILFLLYLTPSRQSIDSSSTVNLKDLLHLAIEAAEKGGIEVVKVSTEPDIKEESKGKSKEGVNLPVTTADYNSHCVMYHGITELYPQIKVISEENTSNCAHIAPLSLANPKPYLFNLPDKRVDPSKIAIWIDPLDATKEYTEKLFDFVTTMVCIAYEGKPIIGVIHKPFGPEPKTNWAWINVGHSFQTETIPETKEETVVIISRSHAGDLESSIKTIFGTGAKLIEAGGSGYKSLELAAGNVTSYIHKTRINKWDICAGDAIITALKGRFTDLLGVELDYSPANYQHSKGIIAAPMDKYLNFIKKTSILLEPKT